MASFRLYRYQLLPIDRHTDDLYDGMSTAQLIERKNEIFGLALPFVPSYRYQREMLVNMDQAQGDAFVFRLAPNRPLTRERPDSTTEQVENWPHISAVVLNAPDEQYIAVQERQAAFDNTDTVIKLVEKATREPLKRAGLRLHVERMFQKNVFWDLVNKYPDRITSVKFEFVTPNMANISGTLTQALKEVSKDTNAAVSDLELKSDPASALSLTTDNPTVSGLVDYTSQGGGDITLKVKGIRKRIRTSTSTQQVELDDLQLSGPAEQVAKVMKSILKELPE